eukprot:TRINITY_DN801_c0_g1_i1.p1 TRINITY_DN801_c0_g1~~TRINITY_DN801_c0_g1_i1.p1  ORF type:complete len:1624 (+),score=491.29 TRINITY_DN801_c0_g1_i1:62-4933(+)
MDLNDLVDLNDQSEDEVDPLSTVVDIDDEEAPLAGVYEDEAGVWWVVCPNPLTAVSCSTAEKIRVYPSEPRWSRWKKITYTEQLSEGKTVMSPDNPDRVSEMRAVFKAVMFPYLGKSGKVIDVMKDSVRMEINGARMCFDLDLFPKTFERLCPQGCSLKSFLTKNDNMMHTCDCCFSQFGDRTPLFGCRAHDYDLCLYCSGMEPSVKAGTKVVRGPTWVWNDQDGGEYRQGTVQKIEHSWVSVRWDTGETNQYRSAPFCDVMANDSEINVNQDSQEKRKILAQKRNTAREKSFMPHCKYNPRNGFHFTNLLPRMKVGDGKKTITPTVAGPCSVFLEETLKGSVSCSFEATKLSPGGKMWFGIEVGKIEKGYASRNIGTVGSLALMCTEEECYAINNEKRDTDKHSCPPLENGDVVTVSVREGEISFFKNKDFVCGGFGFGKDMTYKFGVSVETVGDVVTLVETMDCNLPELPSLEYKPEEGLHFTDLLSSMEMSEDKKTVKRVTADQPCSVYVAETLRGDTLCSFEVKKLTPGESMWFGIESVPISPTLHKRNIGEVGSLALLCTSDECYPINSGKRVKDKGTCPPLTEGDVVTVSVKDGREISFYKNNEYICGSFGFKEAKPYKFGVSVAAVGDAVTLVKCNDSSQIPDAEYKQEEGFHFSDLLPSMKVSDDKKTLTCTEAKPCSPFVAETLGGDSWCSFEVTKLSPDGKMRFGIEIGTVNSSFHKHDLGEISSLALLCTTETCYTVQNAKKVKNKRSTDGIKEGDVVTVVVRDEEISFFKNREYICGGFGFSGYVTYKYGASMSTVGDVVTIVGYDNPSQIPSQEYKPEEGLHFSNVLPSMDVSDDEKTLTRTAEQPCTAFCKETLRETVLCGFKVVKLSPNGKMRFGVECGEIKNESRFGKHMGEAGSLALSCSDTKKCRPINNGKHIKDKGEGPPLKEGDVVMIAVRSGDISFYVNGQYVSGGFSFAEDLEYKYGVSIGTVGDAVEIVQVTDPRPVLGEAEYVEDEGFHLIDFEDGKMTRDGAKQTFVTKELMGVSDETRTVHFKVAMEGELVFGVFGKELVKGQEVPLQDQPGSCGLVVKIGKSKAKLSFGREVKLPAKVKRDDIFSVKVENESGAISFYLNKKLVDRSTSVSGMYRFGITLCEQGDHVVLLKNLDDVSDCDTDSSDDNGGNEKASTSSLLQELFQRAQENGDYDQLQTLLQHVQKQGNANSDKEDSDNGNEEEDDKDKEEGQETDVTGQMKMLMQLMGGMLSGEQEDSDSDSDNEEENDKDKEEGQETDVTGQMKMLMQLMGGMLSGEQEDSDSDSDNEEENDKDKEEGQLGGMLSGEQDSDDKHKDGNPSAAEASDSDSQSDESEENSNEAALKLLTDLGALQGRKTEQVPSSEAIYELLKKTNQIFEESELPPQSTWEKLGCGGFGTVYKTKYKSFDVAVKVQSGKDLEEYNREVKMAMDMERVENAVKIFGFVPKMRAIVMKYYPDGDLETYVKNGGLKTREEKYKMMHNLVKGLEVMTSGVVHISPKPRNILIDKCEPAIADLTKSKDAKSATEKDDVHACGMIFYFILTGGVWPEKTQPDLEHEALLSDKESVDILSECFACKADERPTLAKLIKKFNPSDP